MMYTQRQFALLALSIVTASAVTTAIVCGAVFYVAPYGNRDLADGALGFAVVAAVSLATSSFLHWRWKL